MISDMKNRCEILPLPNHQYQFLIDGVERTRWHFDAAYPRPFFFPIIGASGESLTRMGHPGAPNHDHHRSVWFAHHKVFGHNFWGDGTETKIRQSQWIAIEEGDDSARLAVELDWLDGHDPTPLLKQTMIAEIKPKANGNWTLELQSTFTPTSEELELQQTNFGFLAVRVSKQIAGYFGGGKLTNSEGAETEKNIFGKAARWMDYSGTQFSHAHDRELDEGISYIDHPSNFGQPTRWHVREDGWMGASPCMNSDLMLKKASPTTLRYLLLIHKDSVNPDDCDSLYKNFSMTEPMRVERSTKSHTHASIVRKK